MKPIGATGGTGAGTAGPSQEEEAEDDLRCPVGTVRRAPCKSVSEKTEVPQSFLLCHVFTPPAARPAVFYTTSCPACCCLHMQPRGARGVPLVLCRYPTPNP